MKFELFIIGDEILSGRRQDKHFAAIQTRLLCRGHQLHGVAYLPDEPSRLEAAFREQQQRGLPLISCGGIGATPDDHTRGALARALDRPLVQHTAAAQLIETRFGDAAYPHRIRMAEFPAGASLIPNPVNHVAGCRCEQVHLLPGFPEMAWPMCDWLLEQHYPDVIADICYSLIAVDAREGELIDLMQVLVQRWPAVRFSSLPSYGNARHPGQHIDFSVSGLEPDVGDAFSFLRRALLQRGLTLI
ncbi:competence/damage-inducible protein A [Jeongeupia naejangsanensis]|uniref:Competence/damage-inducible protein A n=1 Tax=Jeongeupia naejangsanensis TaxID=613195 RepID=A0ABS2BLV0_9NEIS|nr:molybdopterin-binding protein [Jeongeupia naejangsanensis]MBM3116591.1 competence/damage-inducible protein A [Jeongeupia naejangsanensis]